MNLKPEYVAERRSGGQWRPTVPLRLTYARLMAVAGFKPLAANLLLLRSADSLWDVIVLAGFTIDHFGLSAVGIAAFCYEAPPVFLAPLAGAALDRYGRKRMVVIYSLLAAVSFGIMGVLGGLGLLALPVFYALVTSASVGVHFSQFGLKTLIPVLVDHRLWDRANGVDTATFVMSVLIGPVVGTIALALVGGSGPVLVMAAMYGAAAFATARLPKIRPGGTPQSLLASSWSALSYTVRNPTLRGLVLVTWVFNFAYGFFTVAVSVLVSERLGLPDQWVGYLWSVSGVAGVVSSIVAGRISRNGRERWLMAFGCLTISGGLVLAGATHSLAAVMIAMVMIGLATGPFDVALFSIRLRRTHPDWVGRVVSVSEGLNNVGSLSGAIAAGLLLESGVVVAFNVSALVPLVGCALAFLAIPRYADVFEYGRNPNAERGRRRPAPVEV